MNWKPVYAVLIFGSTIVTWVCGVLIDKSDTLIRRRLILVTSLIINFGILFTFKYFNFINESVFNLLKILGLRWEVPNLDLLLPVGISFYTFQAVGYTIDVYRKDIKAETHLGIYTLFVSFFPQLVAGPIERAKHLLPQFKDKLTFNPTLAEIGIKQMVWGYFMKVVIADRLSLYVNAVYNNVEGHNGTSLLVATFFFAIQIYCDFAGYSNIAIGAARIMGFDLMTNFNRPYFSLEVGEFWQRWHISLSTWFRDYLYIPMGGNRVARWRGYVNIFVTFLVSGIWHGANWTFMIWGGLHGFYLVFQRTLKDIDFLKPIYKLPRGIVIVFNFILVSFAWIFFRANSVSDAFIIVNKIFTHYGNVFPGDVTTVVYGLFGLTILFGAEVAQEVGKGDHFLNSKNPIVAALSASILVVIILSLGVFDGGQFIYFQF